MAGNEDTPRHFRGRVVVQFTKFFQGNMETDAQGNSVFVGVVEGFFGTPPTGDRLEAGIKLTVGAQFTDDAYEVHLHPSLGQLAARPEFRAGVFQYVDASMTRMVGPEWKQMTFLKASSNVMHEFSQPLVIDFEPTVDSW